MFLKLSYIWAISLQSYKWLGWVGLDGNLCGHLLYEHPSAVLTGQGRIIKINRARAYQDGNLAPGKCIQTRLLLKYQREMFKLHFFLKLPKPELNFPQSEIFKWTLPKFALEEKLL